MHLTSTSQFGTHDLLLEIARGNVLGASAMLKFGRADGIDSANAEDIWDWGGKYNFPTAACQITIESSSSADSAAGTGARTLQIYGLDTNFVDMNETLTLAGRDIVTSVNSYMRLFRMVVRSAGTGEEANGDIVATHTGTTSAIAQVSQGFNQTLMAVYTVPASRTGYMVNWTAGIDRAGINQNRSGDAKLMFRPPGEVFQTKDTAGIFNNYRDRDFKVPLKATEKTDIKVNASAVTNSTAFSATFDLILLDNAVNF